jgi:hypothetical protein
VAGICGEKAAQSCAQNILASFDGDINDIVEVFSKAQTGG